MSVPPSLLAGIVHPFLIPLPPMSVPLSLLAGIIQFSLIPLPPPLPVPVSFSLSLLPTSIVQFSLPLSAENLELSTVLL